MRGWALFEGFLTGLQSPAPAVAVLWGLLAPQKPTRTPPCGSCQLAAFFSNPAPVDQFLCFSNHLATLTAPKCCGHFAATAATSNSTGRHPCATGQRGWDCSGKRQCKLTRRLPARALPLQQLCLATLQLCNKVSCLLPLAVSEQRRQGKPPSFRHSSSSWEAMPK